MATPPYAKILVRLDGGAPLSGGITSASVGQSVQLGAENPSGLTQYRWEIYDYPPDFECPEGWEEASDGTYYSTDAVPAAFDLTHWGDYLFGLYGNESNVKARPAKLTDFDQTAIRMASPAGLVDLSFLEKQQFHRRGWPVGQKHNLRRTEELLSVPVREIAGTSHTFELTDRSKQLRSMNANETTFTVPPQAEVPWPVWSRIHVLQVGAGRLVVAAGAGVTIRVRPGLARELAGQYVPAVLDWIAENEWALYGALAEE